ncbi:probable cytochrome P450 301a1, mitochondrial [Phymastichus coffea]|uniref:probable cytochrome P450 301a1, mitochondrial n=1 Tax=Phymastichus coffea TaxID=108790 RepID=UPI00273CEF9B|nr:probable cytochrome P450 301a1, mitochondrial [Phymastichus coffea]XP_058806916.1 probable cytochrome P450 301a1, mitochondrial [Phymastichus coffea]
MRRAMRIAAALARSRASSRGTSTAATAAATTPTTEQLQHDPRPYEEIPGPKPLPILGNTWRLFPVIGQYTISDVARISQLFHRHYGRITRLTGLIGRPDLLFVFDADEIERVYRQEGPTPFRPSMPCLVKYKAEVRRAFFGELPGVVGVHGEQWREFRTRVQKPVLQPQTVRKYIGPIEAVTDDFIRRIEQIKDDSGEVPGDFDNEIHKWALECIGRVALDARLGCLGGELAPDSQPQKIIDAAKYALRNVAVLELKAPFWRYIPTPLWTHYVRNMDFFVQVCMKHIDAAMDRLREKRRSGVEVPESELSLVERILAKETDPKMAYILALDLILVGIDTISMAVCSILYQLATRPEEQDKIHRELMRVAPDLDRPLTTGHLDRAHYTKAFIKEVFRMYSTVIGNGRTLQHDMVLCGYHVPKGVQVVFPTLVTGCMEEFVEDAKTFKPSRWLKESTGQKLHPFASLPYGYGARMCLGRRFADLEMQVLLAKLLRRYKIEYKHEPLKYKVTFMYAPDGQLRFNMLDRTRSAATPCSTE